MCPASLNWKRKYIGGKITAKLCRSNKNRMNNNSGLKEAYIGEVIPSSSCKTYQKLFPL
jgi:hypothetical protein